ncbi:MAG: hypothetical protein CFE29_26540 [Bradyrhizobiaceae bacterium PARB1]|jgi:hypothetical protein|nr:MAG: hypothetical protein CFE29_26540 [Bradyrhizobiaceae bacterium PARB1]
MTTPARIIANQRNARRSTGPRSLAGKQAASRNAFRHGLNIPIGSNVPEVSTLAKELAADLGLPITDLAVIGAARAVIEVERVRSAYYAFYKRAAASLAVLQETASSVMPSSGNDPLGLMAVFAIFEAQWREPDGPPPLTLPELALELDRLARYERRAYSARKKALRRLVQEH